VNLCVWAIVAVPAMPTLSPTLAPTTLDSVGANVIMVLDVDSIADMTRPVLLSALTGRLAGADPSTDIKALEVNGASVRRLEDSENDDETHDYWWATEGWKTVHLTGGYGNVISTTTSFSLPLTRDLALGTVSFDVSVSLASLGFPTFDEFEVSWNVLVAIPSPT